MDELYTIGDSSFDIPEELLIEILSRLPLKSLARFKCVSKQWLFFILNDVTVTNDPKLLIFSRLNRKKTSLCSLDKKTHSESLCSPFKQKLSPKDKVNAHSSCHGLLLIQRNSDLFLWNPLTNFFRKVLSLSNYFVPNWELGDFSVADLCYCAANYEYKVVLVMIVASTSPRYCYVATCRGESWKRIDINLKDLFQGPFFKGYRHWCGNYFSATFHGSENDSIPPGMSIVYFDPSMNKFIKVAEPKPKEGQINTFLSLGVYDECLCVTRWDGSQNYLDDIELLVMKEYKNGNSWEVMFVFSNMPRFRFFGATKNLFKTKEGEIWMSMYMYGKCRSVKAFDVNGNFLRDIWVRTRDNSSYSDFCDVVLYEESWFSPTGYNWGENY